jgi:hypothetical protein
MSMRHPADFQMGQGSVTLNFQRTVTTKVSGALTGGRG